MKVLIVIPARKGSKRAKNKNIRLVNGKPLIAYTIESALRSKLAKHVLVSTDSKDIADVAGSYGIAAIKRPDEFAQDTSPIEDALRHAVLYIKKEIGFEADILVWLQANVPIRKDGEIDEVIDMLTDNDYSAVATAYEVDQRPEWMKVLNNKKGIAEPLMPDVTSYRIQDLPKYYLLDGNIIAIKVDVLMNMDNGGKVHGFMGNALGLFIHDKKYAMEVDNENDFEMIEYFLSR